MVKAIDVAQYITTLIDVDHLKLQKLVYYSQAVHLVCNKNPLFNDIIEAWQYGPVVRSVYKKYKRYGFDVIPKIQKQFNFTPREFEAIDMTLKYYGKMSGIELVALVHQDAPWVDAFKKGRNSVISIKDMYNYYKDAIEFED